MYRTFPIGGFSEVLRGVSMHIIVDGYNLIRQSDVLRRSRADQPRRGAAGAHPEPRRLPEAPRTPDHGRLRRLGGGLAHRGAGPCRGRGDHLFPPRGEGRRGDQAAAPGGKRGDHGCHLRPGDRHLCRPPREDLHRLASPSRRGSSGSPRRPSSDADTPGEETEEEEDDRRAAAKKKGPARRLSKQKRTALARIRKFTRNYELDLPAPQTWISTRSRRRRGSCPVVLSARSVRTRSSR